MEEPQEIEFVHIDYQVQRGIATVTVINPKELNVLSQDVLIEIAQAVELIAENAEVRVAVFTGEGKAFSAGTDLRHLQGVQDVFAAREHALLGQTVFGEIAALPVPTIAAINGFALGAGLELALACDLRVAGKGAKLGQNETSLGLIPSHGGTQRLPRLIGFSRAMDLLLTSRFVGVEEALEMGLVNRVVEDALEGANELALQIQKNSPVAVAIAKESLNRGADLDLPRALEIEADLFGMACATKDMKEGVAASLAKRSPEFTGE